MAAKYIDVKSYALAMLGDIWLIDRSAFDRIGVGVASSFAEGVDEDIRDVVYSPCDREMAAAIREGTAIDLVESRHNASGKKPSGITAVLPLYGLIEHRSTVFGEFMGGTSTESFGRAFKQMINSPNVSSIVIDVDSPGGTVFGVPELAAEIFSARDAGKPIVSQVNPYCASAATWIATASHRVNSIPSGEAGSIGVYAVHTDMSQMLEDCGIRETLIKSGKSPFKAEFNSSEPLSDEGRAYIQEEVDRVYDLFASAVASHRGVDVGTVEANFGMGRMMAAPQARKVGLIDRIASRDETIQRVRSGKIKVDKAASEDDWDSPATTSWTVGDERRKYLFRRRKNAG